VLAVAAVCVTSPRVALTLLCSLGAAGCYTLVIIAVPQLRSATTSVLRKADQ